MAKGNKDPNKPKRGKSAYNFFVQHQRNESKEPSKSLLQDCAELWKKMNDEDKKPFNKLAVQDKERYQKEMASYTPTPQKEDVAEKKSRKRKREKDPNQPKRSLWVLEVEVYILVFIAVRYTNARHSYLLSEYFLSQVSQGSNAGPRIFRFRSAYFFFCNDERPKVKEEKPDCPVTDVAKILGQRWAQVDDKQKEKYQEMAAKDKARYEEEMKMYKNGEFVLPPSKKVSLESEVEDWQVFG